MELTVSSEAVCEEVVLSIEVEAIVVIDIEVWLQNEKVNKIFRLRIALPMNKSTIYKST